MSDLSFAERVSGHAWTVWPTARDLVLRPHHAAFFEHTIPIVDDQFGPTALSCSLAVPEGATSVVVLVHGLGSSRHSAPVQRAAVELHRLGLATLALDLRGADRRGGGFYHMALTEDLTAACASALCKPFQKVFVLGFSMGGHVALHFAATRAERRLAGVAALCTPLDLRQSQQHLDQATLAFYRRWVLRGLKGIYDAVARRHAVAVPARDVWRSGTFHEWDRLTVAKRFGFASPEDYYERCSARWALPKLAVESVLVLAQNDPIVPPELALPWVSDAAAGTLRVCVLPRGGHLQFPNGQDCGLGRGGSGVVEQIARHWQRL